MSAVMAADALEALTGYRPPDPAACGSYEVGPLLGAEHLSPSDFWLALIAPYVKIVRVRERLDTRWPNTNTKANMWRGDREMDFSVERTSRRDLLEKDKLPFKFGFIPNDGQELRELETEVGPIVGRMSINDALRIFIGPDDDLMITWHYEEELDPPETVLVGPTHKERVFADMSESVCSFGYKELPNVTVTRSRLPWDSIADATTSPTIMDRTDIESSGKDNLPDMLQQLSQTAFHRGLGYRPTGTQCAVLRGVGPVKVMINGKSTFGSAADFIEDCTDLNSIPLSAIERIEVSPDVVSLAHGADAMGGMINVILKQSDTQTADARYQGARGGAGVLHSSIVAGISTDNGHASLVFDYSDTSSLVGSQRERWRNQDFRSFGSRDYRSLFADPPNVTALGGGNLAGLNSSMAAVRASPAGAIEFAAGEENRSSLLAWQSIVPEIVRMNVSAIGERELGTALLRSELLMANRSSTFGYPPELVPGFVLGEHHPQNPFLAPVTVQATLTGLPLPEQDVQSTLLRGVLQVDGNWSTFDYSAYALHSTEEAASISRNFVDYDALAESLSGLTDSPLNVLSARPGRGGEHILSPTTKVRSVSGGTIIAASARGNVIKLPDGYVSAQFGAESRREFADYGSFTEELDRNAVSAFGIIQLPVVKSVRATFGTRLDDFETLDRVTSNQYAIEWRPLHRLRVSASYNDTFAAPRMFDLFFPVLTFPTAIFDPSWRQVVPVNIISGGNESLRPTVGRSSTVGLLYSIPESSFSASIDLFRVSLTDRIASIDPLALLSYEDSALAGRIVRDRATPDDIAANRLGRLRTLDLRRANFGETETRGLDLSIASTFTTDIGLLTPRLDITFTDDFRYSDLPSVRDRGRERTGVADVLGTITKWRMRGWLSYRHPRGWNANFLARFNSCYEDFDTVLGLATDRAVCPGITIDLNIAKEIGEHFKVTLGVSDLLDRSPSFSEVYGKDGYDSSQDDLVGRSAFIAVSGRL